MKTLLISIFTLFSASTFANYRWDLERNLRVLGQQVNALSNQNADLLTVEELRQSIRKLKDVKGTLLGFNRDYPRPVCSQESPDVFKRAFKSIKHFAYSVKGPELTKEEAINYAIDWTNTYPCNYHEQFERVFQTVKIYGYASNGGLNMSKEDAIRYAIEMTPSFCGDFNFKQDYFASYKLARYEMELPEQQAINYAKRNIERMHFSCRYDDVIVEDNVDLYNTPRIDIRDICINPVIIAPIPRR